MTFNPGNGFQRQKNKKRPRVRMPFVAIEKVAEEVGITDKQLRARCLSRDVPITIMGGSEFIQEDLVERLRRPSGT